MAVVPKVMTTTTMRSRRALPEEDGSTQNGVATSLNRAERDERSTSAPAGGRDASTEDGDVATSSSSFTEDATRTDARRRRRALLSSPDEVHRIERRWAAAAAGHAARLATTGRAACVVDATRRFAARHLDDGTGTRA
jgi:hypothetical protein